MLINGIVNFFELINFLFHECSLPHKYAVSKVKNQNEFDNFFIIFNELQNVIEK